MRRIHRLVFTLVVAVGAGPLSATGHHPQESPPTATAAAPEKAPAQEPAKEPAKEPEKPKSLWATSLGAGLTASRGNSNSTNLNVSFNTKWDPKTIRTFKAEFLYIEETEDNEETVDKSSGLIRYEQRFNYHDRRRHWFAEMSYSRDVFKDIGFLVSPRVGIGRSRAWRKETVRLVLDVSAGTATEQNLTGAATATGAAAQLGQTLDIAFTNTKINQKSSILFKTGDFNDAIYHFDAGLTTSIAKHFDVKITYIFEYKTQPDFGDVLNTDTSLITTLLVKW